MLDPGISYSFDVYITRNTGGWTSLGHLIFVTETFYSDLVFSYNSSSLENPVVSNLSSISVDTIVDNSVTDVLSVNLVDGGTEVPFSETLLMTITFDIVNPDATSQLSWRFGDTTIIDENSNNFNYFDGTLELIGSDNTYLPVGEEVESDINYFINTAPNPFGSTSLSTMLLLKAPEDGKLILNIYNIKGQLETTLYNSPVRKNQEIQISWGGKNSEGKKLSSGIYLCQILVDDCLFETKKIVIIR